MPIDVTEEIENFESASYGKDVRGSLVSLAEKLTDEVNDAVANQLLTARVNGDTLIINGANNGGE